MYGAYAEGERREERGERESWYNELAYWLGIRVSVRVPCVRSYKWFATVHAESIRERDPARRDNVYELIVHSLARLTIRGPSGLERLGATAARASSGGTCRCLIFSVCEITKRHKLPIGQVADKWSRENGRTDRRAVRRDAARRGAHRRLQPLLEIAAVFSPICSFY